MKLETLRKSYPKFIFSDFDFNLKSNGLEIVFYFEIESKFKFSPTVHIYSAGKEKIKKLKEKQLRNFIFHLGLIEMLSYWKATCSPEIEILAGDLNAEQKRWWKNLIFKGMGQFFYENKINFLKKDFLKIKSKGKVYEKFKGKLNKEKFLVPVSGGKDSIVTLEKLKEEKKQITAFVVNPNPVTEKVLKIAGIKNKIIVKRVIDPTLLKLNQKGFLNGHTPFTALLSFYSVFLAVIFGHKNVVFSNEKSANEGNLRYLGKIINHQWSKSSEFERKFQHYVKKYLATKIKYFSFLRNYSELEISKIFLKYPQYFSIFSSCNRGIKIGKKWCGNCAKCLFVYLTLYPFLVKKLLLKIFGQDVFENKKLLPIMKGLIDKNRPKPFECVGTKKESRLAFILCLKKAKKTGKIPFLLRKVRL